MRISQKLVIILLFIGLLPAVGMSIIAYATIRNEAANTVASQLQSTAIRQEQRINVLLRAKLEEVSKFTNQLNLQLTLREFFANSDEQARNELVNILSAKRVTFPDIQQIHISTLDGEVIASTLPDMIGEGYDAEPGMTVQRDERDDVNKLHISIAVLIDRQESALATVVFRMDDLVAVVQDYTGLGETGETLVIERHDPEAVSLFPLREDTAGALHQSLRSMDMADHITTSTYNARSYTGDPVIATVRQIGAADWLLAVSIDQDEAFAASIQLRNALLWVMAGASIIIVLIALAMTRSITAPILRIVRTSQAIGEGDLTARSDIVRTDEIGILSESINKMGSSLRGYVNNIQGERHRLEVILNSATESIIAIDNAGVIIMANHAAAELSGDDLQDVVGRPIDEVFAWQRGGHAATVEYYPPEVRVYNDLEYTTMTGEVRYIKVIVSPVKAKDEQSVQSIVTIHDETKSRELENMKIDFVSMAAHELRTPLAALRGYLELAATLERETQPNDKSSELVTKALKSTSELSGLINNLLDVARIERGALTFDLGKVDAAATIASAVEEAQLSAEEKHIELTYSGPKADSYAYADNLAVREVMNNLLSNAVKYTGEGGHISVKMQQTGDMYEVSVKDTGIGIPKRALPHLFTKFYRVHGGLDSGSTGTGLGLFITKSILDRHNGKITVESEEGIGSNFTFTLPVYAHQDDKTDEALGVIKKSRRHRGWFTKNIDR